MLNKFKFALAVIAATVVSASAGHAGVITVTKSAALVVPNIVVSFDAPNAPGYVWNVVPHTATGNHAGLYKDPAGDGTVFGYVTNLSKAGGYASTLTLPTVVDGLSVYVGSLDSFNDITFYKGAVAMGMFSGADLKLITGAHDNGAAASSYRFAFDFGGMKITSVKFASLTGNSMEIDNIAISPAPEASVWAMLLLGFGAIGLMLRSVKRGKLAGFTA